MKKHPARLYGDIFHFPGGAFQALRTALEEDPLFPQDAVTHEGEHLAVEFEGPWSPAEALVEALTPLLPPEAEGKLDAIDEDEWVLTRYVIVGGRVEAKRIDLDTVLSHHRTS